MLLQVHPSVRLRPPAELTAGEWFLEQLLLKRRFRVSRSVAAVVLLCFRPIHQDALLAQIADGRPSKNAQVIALLSTLKERRIIYDASVKDEDAEWVSTLSESWAKNGWEGALDYQLWTHDIEFIDYQHGGREEDWARMVAYASAKADVSRVKRYPEHEQTVRLPTPSPPLLPGRLADVFNKHRARSRLCVTQLSKLLSLVFGKLDEIRVRWPGAAPLIRRTAPSGGSRHPTEAYVWVRSVDGLAPGWYHIASDPPLLEFIERADANEAVVQSIAFGAMSRAPFQPDALVILTCVFERVMYRYREARTFRPLHIDAGHLTANLECFGRSLGLEVYVNYGLHDSALEAVLGIDGFAEGAMLSVALASGVDLLQSDERHERAT